MTIAIALLLLIFLTIVAAEIGSRIYLRNSAYRVFAAHRKDWMQLDMTVHPQLEQSVRFEINSLGERGSEPPSTNFKHILLVGGSAIESFFVDQDKTWPKVLERKLNSEDSLKKLGSSKIHVGNIGRSGVDSKTLELVLDKVLPNYKELETIIIMVGASDVLRWLEIGAPIDRPAEAMDTKELFAQHPQLDFSLSPKGLAIVEIFRRLRTRIPTRKENAGRWYKKARAMRANAATRISDVPPHEVVVDNFKRNLQSCISKCKQKARNVVVIPQPWLDKPEYTDEERAIFWNGGVGKAYKEDITVYYSETVIAKLMRKIADATTEISNSNNVKLIDLFEVLKPILPYFHDQFHFTPESSELIGNYVGKRLTEMESKV